MYNKTALAPDSGFVHVSTGQPNITISPLPAQVLLIRNICIPVFVIIFVFGVFGNALTVIVLRSSRLQHTSTAIYLMALAIVDILYLLASLLITIINYTFLFPGELRHYSPLACVITPFLHYTLAYLSVWLLVAVTVDRAIWIAHPFSAKHMCTKKNAWITIIFLTILLILLDSHFFWTMAYIPRKQTFNNSQSFECQASYFTKTVFPYIDLLLICVLPFIFMLIGNSLIGCQLKRMRDFNRKRQQGKVKINHLSQIHSHNLKNGCNQVFSCLETQTNIVNNGGSTNCRYAMRSKTVQHSIKNSIKNRVDNKSSSLTAMLIAINVFFMVTVSPLLVYDVIYFAVNLYQWIEIDETNRGVLVFGIERFVYTLWYTNFSVHFLLYCLSGPQFRAQVKRWFGSWCFRFSEFDFKTNMQCTTYNPDKSRQRKIHTLNEKSQAPDELYQENQNYEVLFVHLGNNFDSNNGDVGGNDNSNNENNKDTSFQVRATCYECPKIGST